MKAFEKHEDVSTALSAYEQERKPVVESLMSAAERSRIHFEDIRRYFDLPAQQFALHHLTRTGRLTYGSLQHRDASFTDAFDEWFAKQTPGDTDVRPPAQQPLRLQTTNLANRYVRVVSPTIAATEGKLAPAQQEEFVAAAAEEPGLLLSEPLAISASGRPTAGSPGIYADEHSEIWENCVATIPENVTVGAHLVHAGPNAGREAPLFDFGPASAREDTWAPRQSDSFPTPPRAFQMNTMDGELRATVRKEFVDAADRAARAGFEYLQIHAGPNTLLGKALVAAPGSFQDRIAFPTSVIEAVQSVWPDDAPLGVTLPVSNRSPAGISLEDAFTVVDVFSDSGCDIVAPVDVATDVQDPGERGPSDYSDAIRNELDIPTLAIVPTTSPDKMNTLVATGRADLCTFPVSRPK